MPMSWEHHRTSCMTAHKVDSPSTDSSSDSRSGETLDIIARETGIDRSLLLPDATIEALGVASLDLTLALFELEKHFDIEIPVVAERASDGPPAAGRAQHGKARDHLGRVVKLLRLRRAERRARLRNGRMSAFINRIGTAVPAHDIH